MSGAYLFAVVCDLCGATLVTSHDNRAHGMDQAQDAGWTHRLESERSLDLCPGCTGKRKQSVKELSR